MINRQSIDWRRWAAMLCIALAAVFAFDPANAASPCADVDCAAACACDLGACNDQGETGAPCTQHHCCGHGASACEPSMGATTAIRASVKVGLGRREAFVASGCLDTLERPPKTAAVI